MNEQMQEWPRGIAAVTLFVDDLDAARSFYREVFELEVGRARWGRRSTLICPGGGRCSLRSRAPSSRRCLCNQTTLDGMRLEVRFQAVPVEGLRAFLEPLGYRF